MIKFITVKALYPARTLHLNVDCVEAVIAHDFEDGCADAPDLMSTICTTSGKLYDCAECPGEILDAIMRVTGSEVLI